MLIADDQRVVREGLTMVLGLMPGVEIVGSARDGEEAIALVEQLQPDVVLMDLRMPRCDGVEATRRLTQSGTPTKVVVLTTYADDHSVIQALRAGACGFLTKDAGSPEIAAALEAAKRGESAIDPAVQHHLVRAIARTAPAAVEPHPTRPSCPTVSRRARRPSSRSSPKDSPTPRSPSASPSPKPPSRATSTTCTARPARATEHKRSPTPTATASRPDPKANDRGRARLLVHCSATIADPASVENCRQCRVGC